LWPVGLFVGNKPDGLASDELEQVELFQKLTIWRDEETLRELEAETAKLWLQLAQAKNLNLVGRPSDFENRKPIVSVENKR